MTAAGDADSGLHFQGGGWNGMVNVDIYSAGDGEDRVRITITDHPECQQKHCTEIFAGPLVASEVHKEKRRLRKRRAMTEARMYVKRKLDKTNVSIVHDTSKEDPFFLDETEQS